MKSEKRYLIRRLTIIYKEGRTQILPLVVLTCTEKGSKIEIVSIIPFENELPGVIYLSTMTLRELSETVFEVMAEQF